MKSLKEKLVERAEDIKQENESDIIESEYIQNGNVILLNNKDENNLAAVVPDFQITMMQAKERIQTLQKFVKEMMVPNIDYGIIPRCDKPSLFKSGAEKLCDIFGFSKQVDVLNRIEDWEKGKFHYEVKITLINKRSGHVEAEGIGSCNSMERKYKNQDGFSIANTILKMAKKRAFIDAVLSATRSSGIFTQDIEDDETYQLNQKTSDTNQNNLSSNLSNHQTLSCIANLVSQKKIPINQVKSFMLQRYNVTESKQLNEYQANDFFNFLKSI